PRSGHRRARSDLISRIEVTTALGGEESAFTRSVLLSLGLSTPARVPPRRLTTARPAPLSARKFSRTNRFPGGAGDNPQRTGKPGRTFPPCRPTPRRSAMLTRRMRLPFAPALLLASLTAPALPRTAD